ncbi:MAG TPA: DUF2231 domain-containing protein [Gemmatimonadales bacterium]|nr:DUF2231 domain-containing protein [Gemmatimonadales bacterium]
MESRAKFLGHPVHPMLIVFPLGLLATAVIFDIIALFVQAPPWNEVAFYLIGAGVIGGIVAAVFGWVDWTAIPSGTRAKRIGLTHGIGNVVVVALFALSWVLRRDQPAMPSTEAVVAGIVGLVIALFTGWLGGELVDRLGVGVDEGAHLNAPSSLSELPASTNRGGGPGSARWTGPERRMQPAHAYAGVERRRVR